MNGLLPPAPETSDYLDYFAYQIIQTEPGTPERRSAWRALAIGTAACITETAGAADADSLNQALNGRLQWAAAETGRDTPPETVQLGQQDWRRYLHYARAGVVAAHGYRTPDAISILRGFATGKLRCVLRPDGSNGHGANLAFMCRDSLDSAGSI